MEDNKSQCCAAKTMYEIMCELHRRNAPMTTSAIKSYIKKLNILSSDEINEKSTNKDEWLWAQTKKYSQYYVTSDLILKGNSRWSITDNGIDRISLVGANALMEYALNGKDYDYSLKKHIQERLGVSAVEKLCCDMGWIFRERGHTDYGIDADVEVADSKMTLTSHHIAIQIKSGESYIKKEKGGKVIFQFDHKHNNYWRSSDRPLVVIVNAPDGSLYWSQIDENVTIRTGKLFKVYLKTINPDNIDETKNGLMNVLVSFSPSLFRLPNYSYSEELLKFYSSRIVESISTYCSLFKNALETIKNSKDIRWAVLDYIRCELLKRYSLDKVTLALFDEQFANFASKAQNGVSKGEMQNMIKTTAPAINAASKLEEAISYSKELISLLKTDASSTRQATICDDILKKYEKLYNKWQQKYLKINREK